MADNDVSNLTADPDPLVALRRLTAVREQVAREEAVLVRRARVAGASWVAIAQALGVSKQAVHKKYGGRRMGR